MISVDRMAKAVGTVRYIAWLGQDFDGTIAPKVMGGRS